VTAIWSTDETGWRLLAPVGFPDEAALHEMVEKAPQSLSRIEVLVAPVKVGQGTTTRDISEEVLEAIADAYREAASGRISAPPAADAM